MSYKVHLYVDCILDTEELALCGATCAGLSGGEGRTVKNVMLPLSHFEGAGGAEEGEEYRGRYFEEEDHWEIYGKVEVVWDFPSEEVK